MADEGVEVGEGVEAVEEPGWEVAKVVESNEEATLVVGFLESNGIPAEIESLHVDELPVNVGALGEVRVEVPPDRLAEAQALLAQVEAENSAPPVEPD